jgi:hypothetical protein
MTHLIRGAFLKIQQSVVTGYYLYLATELLIVVHLFELYLVVKLSGT